MGKARGKSEHTTKGNKLDQTSPKGRRRRVGILREWIDALVIALVLASFIRIFIVELYKIPTGSMTPTLIGGVGGAVAHVDVNEDGQRDLIYFRDHGQPPLLFVNNGQQLVAEGETSAISPADKHRLQHTDRLRRVSDRILVSKFAYWFGSPRRGDIVIFKVPRHIWSPEKSIYVKRAVSRPGDHLSFDQAGHLIVNGLLLNEPEFFTTQRYRTVLPEHRINAQPEIQYTRLSPSRVRIERIEVPQDEIYVLGDNTHGSLDSRYWGGVPLVNLKGRAFFRYWPLDRMGFLSHEG